MSRTPPSSVRSRQAAALVEALQLRLVTGLVAAAREAGDDHGFTEVRWLRDGGRHGGGERFQIADTPVYDRASVNVSVIHYDDLPDKVLAGATALSSIVHPRHPRAPSMHTHVSWTERRGGSGYWRIMGDLNPSHPDPAATSRFEAEVAKATGDLYVHGREQGARYFYIPALERHRGVSHFYLEGHHSESFENDLHLAKRTGEAIVDVYLRVLGDALRRAAPATDDERRTQLHYHTLYFFQVLTLDRGTTSGLLVHDQNDVGILGSLPSHVDRDLLATWEIRVPPIQRPLVRGLVDTLPDTGVCLVDEDVKRRLCEVVRAHYRLHPEALEHQAAGDVVPPTVANHR